MIAPTTTLTPQGPADTGYAGDYWQFNTRRTCQSTPSIQEDTLHTIKNTVSSSSSREQHTPLCKFGETVQYMLPTVKQYPKPEPRFYNRIWLGKDTTTGKSLLGLYNKIVRARTIRRQIMPHTMSNYWTVTVYTQVHGRHQHQHCTHQLLQHHCQCQLQARHHHHRQMQQLAQQQKARDRAQQKQAISQQSRKEQQSQHHLWLHHQHPKRPSLPAPPPTSPARERDDTIAEGSTGKQQRTTAERQALDRPATSEQPKSKMGINAIELTTKDGKQMQTTSNEGAEEIKHNEVRARIVVKGYTEPVTDHNLLFSSTPLFLHAEDTSYNGIGVQLVSQHRRCHCCIHMQKQPPTTW